MPTDYACNESVDGIAHVWELRLPRGGRAEVRILPTRATYFMGVAREVPPQLTWRGVEAVAPDDVRSLASALLAAAEKAETLPRAVQS
jgi:hypothetical protein